MEGAIRGEGFMSRRFISPLATASLILIFCQISLGVDPRSIQKNNEAASLLAQERFFEAYQKLLSAVEGDPRSEVIHINLGLAFEKTDEKEKALAEYLSAASLTQDPELKFFAHFNAARLLGEQQKIDLALAEYQKALDLKPDSKEVKTNIELLFQGGGGQGEGDSKDSKGDDQGKSKDPKDDKGQDQKQKQPQQYDTSKPKPKPFQSKELSPNDAKQILDEMKRQEEKARSNFKNDKSTPKDDNGKDW